MCDAVKPKCSPFSSGGGGVNFETRIQTLYAVLMLSGGFAPCLRPWPIKKLKLQGQYKGFSTDDFIAFTQEPNGAREAKLLAQIKHRVSITENDPTFAQVIGAAWQDFSNPELFDPETDAIALIAGPLSALDTENARILLEWARTSQDSLEFMEKVGLARFSSEEKRTKLAAFRKQLEGAKGQELTDDELWRFLRSFHILGYDFDVENGVILSLTSTIIERCKTSSESHVWEQVLNHVQYANQNAGTITLETVPSELREAFRQSPVHSEPPELAAARPPSTAKAYTLDQSPDDLAMALMLGGWHESLEADKRAVEELTGSVYRHWIGRIRKILHQPDSPLTLRNGLWNVESPLELWKVLAPRVFDEHLERFRRVAVTVLRELDPALDLEPEERHQAQIHGKALAHSRALRKGVATTLAVLTNHQDLFISCSRGKVEAVAPLVTREVLKSVDWKQWASLDDVLPLLGEAAPISLLDASEKGLRSTPSPFQGLFEQERPGIMGRTHITGLLWALETLAWESAFLVRVVAVLGALASIDPGGNWANRPCGSLSTILLPWLPQTLAPLETRESAVKVLLREHPDIAWNVLLSLLPGKITSSFGCRKPQWRQGVPKDRKDGVEHTEYLEQTRVYSEMAVELAKQDPARLLSLVGHIDDLPPTARKSLLKHLQSEQVTGIDDESRVELWERLEEIAAKHRHYPDADWALPPQEVHEIQEAAEALAPRSPMYRFQRLFGEHAFDLMGDQSDYRQQAQELAKKQLDAVTRLFKSEGLGGLKEFASRVESPHVVGVMFAGLEEESLDREIVPDLLVSKEESLASFADGFTRRRFADGGWRWAEKLDMESWDAEHKGKFFANLPFTSDIWTYLSGMSPDDQSVYWENTHANPFDADSNLDMAIRHLLRADRPDAALRCAGAALDTHQEIDIDTLLDTLKAVSQSSFDTTQLDRRAIIHAIAALQQREDAPRESLVGIEFRFLPLLEHTHGAGPVVLERCLAEDPHFFAEAIRAVYVGRAEIPETREPTQEGQEYASRVFRLLFHWKHPPGLKEDGSFDGDDFAVWLSQVKAECESSGHLEVALVWVGRVLINCPGDPDGLWLPRPVAEALNEPDAEPMRSGFRSELFNSRGAHTLTEGREENRLAEKYEERAQAVEEYHRLAAELRILADEYRRDAQLTEDDYFA